MTEFLEGRATYWQLRTRRLEFSAKPALMGIVNITPDSFSDGGKFYSPSQAIDHALRLEDDGADIIDIGGESTRPYSDPVSTDEELARVVPVLEGLHSRLSIPISIDTSKAVVAKAAIALGAEIINDVTGLERDPEMISVALESGAAVCAMHMQGTPQTMQDSPTYADVVTEIMDYLAQRHSALKDHGIAADKICLDPGIGFGKTHEHNIILLHHADQYLKLGCPILIGHSRKGMIGKLIPKNSPDRISGSVGISLAMAVKGIQILRVHDVRETRDALLAFLAVA